MQDDGESNRGAPTAPGSPSSEMFYNRSSATPSNAIDIPRLTLPKGGGAIHAIDEKFTVNPANGSAQATLPLPLTPARSAPSLKLGYDSGNGNGPFGLGWMLDLAAIQRRTNKQLPRYADRDESDVFTFSGSEDLVPMLHDDGTPWESTSGAYHLKRYRPRVETGFSRIERVWRDGDASFYWKVTSRANAVTFYGLTAASRLADPTDPRKVFRWLPELSFDDQGNVVAYEYKAEDGAPGPSGPHDRNRYDDQNQPRFVELHLKRVHYGNRQPFYPAYVANPADVDSRYNPSLPASVTFSLELVFDYGEHGALPAAADTQATVTHAEQQPWPARPDAHSDYRAGFEVRTLRLCRRLLLFHRFDELGPQPVLVRSLDLAYAPSLPGTAQLAEVTYLTGATARGYTQSAGELYWFTALPQVSYSYQPLAWQTSVHDLAIENAPEGLSDTYQWLDLYGEGVSGILTEQAGSLYYNSNLGDGRFSGAVQVARLPSFSGLGTPRLSLQDLDADGSRQLVSRAPEAQGYFEIDDANAWQPFRAFEQRLNADINAPNVLQIDLDGDGRPDLMITEECVVRWHPSLGRAGHAPAEYAAKVTDEEKGPVVIWNDPIQRIFLADLSGDGLSDVVRIRNGEICYWPNLGYGRFGAKVAMEGAPLFARPEIFDARNLQLADVSGTGASDVIYLDGSEANVWLNLSGNGWSAPYTIALPETMRPNRVSTADLLGQGTACLVWSSPLPASSYAPIRYVDLMGGRKPHLMIGYDNGIGKQVSLEYRASTYFYLADRRAGTPWKTRLPFPVQCLSRVETRETVTNTLFVEEYSYHHGYYDHAEREFRGFGRVDHTDAESYSRWVRQNAANVLDEGFHEPTMLTRTWFHTGAPPDDGDLLALFQADYWHANPELLAIPGVQVAPEPSLPPASLPANLTPPLSPQELREAWRACKGMTIRRETFALDAPASGATDAQRALQLTPYSVSLHNCDLQRLQPAGANRYSVFLVHERESLLYTYERAPADARVQHTLALEIDGYGNAWKSATVSYGRQLAAQPADTPDPAWQAQTAMHVVVTEKTFTDDDFTGDSLAYRLPLECEAAMFELTGVSAPASALWDLETLKAIYKSAPETAYELVAPNDNVARKRLLERQRTLFLGDDLASPRALKKASPLGLTFQGYVLALTPTLLRSLFPITKIPDASIDQMLVVDGKYVHFDDQHGTSDTNFWIPSGTTDYLDPQKAPLRFYQAAGYVDARGAQTTVRYFAEDQTRTNSSAHWGLLALSQDAAGNQSQLLAYDFRSLGPTRMQDVNNNFTEVVFDDLGRVIASAVLGKGTEADSLDALKLKLADRAAQAQTAQQFLDNADDADATWLLQDATVRWIYDQAHVPVRAAGIRRERHVADLVASADPLKLQLSFDYTGGDGEVVMTKARVAPGDAWTLDAQDQKVLVQNADPRWAGNGRTVFDNKGQAVKKYEPYFSVTHRYESDQQLTDVGVSPTMTYDSIGRLARTDHPDGTFGHTVFDAWMQKQYDVNDTVKSSQWYADRIALPATDPAHIAAAQTELHDDTPLTTFLDSLGRPMCSVAHERGKDGNGVEQETFPRIVATLGIDGHVLVVEDPRGNQVSKHGHDMLGRPLYQWSMDAGERWTLPDVTSATIYAWDSRDQRKRSVHDALGRPIEDWLSIGGATETLRAKIIYGELAPKPETHNLRGRPWKSYHSSGLAQSIDVDFKGNLLETHRQYVTDYTQAAIWPATNPDSLLDSETFRVRNIYDALNRVTHSFSPDTPTITATEIIPGYDPGGRLSTLNAKLRGAATATAFVTSIVYNAKGQRLTIQYGNGAASTSDYDPLTFRLSRLLTTRTQGSLQDLNYVYDPIGNVVSFSDNAQQTAFFNGTVASPSQAFEYDSLYRLTRALGREQIGQNLPVSEYDAERTGNILAGDAQAMQPYDQRYEYDLAGNMLNMIHNAGSGSFVHRWTRAFVYDTTSNHLLTTQTGNAPVSYSYNPHGSAAAMPHLQLMEWDPSERLQHIQQGTTDAYYGYDGSGVRSRKVVVKQGGLQEIRLYLGGFEIFRRFQNGSLILERETQHFMDDKRRIAIVDTLTAGTDDAPPISERWQFGNQLGSVSLETDQHADIITYEEYYPFGSTSWQAGRSAAEVSLKRYRYTGFERDGESGFNYQGARYYAPWLARWSSADPTGTGDGLNVYAYVANNPVVHTDPTGTQCDRSIQTCKPDEGPLVERSQEAEEQMSSEQGHISDEFEYNRAVLHEAIRTKTLVVPKVDVAKQLTETVKKAATPEYKAAYSINYLKTHPLPIERTFWNRGGGTLVTGGVVLVLGVGGIFTGGGTWFLLGAGMATAGGAAGVGVGTAQLATTSFSTAEKDAEVNHAADTMFALSSPGGLIGGTTGLLLYGNEEGLHKGAFIGGLTEFGGGLAKDAAVYAYLNNPIKGVTHIPSLTVGIPGPGIFRFKLRTPLEQRARFLQYKLYSAGAINLFEATRKSAISIIDVGELSIITHTSEAAYEALKAGKVQLRPYEILGPSPSYIGGKSIHAEINGLHFVTQFYENGTIATYPNGCIICTQTIQNHLPYRGFKHLNPAKKK
jgi:RHS repeat-associated protein